MEQTKSTAGAVNDALGLPAGVELEKRITGLYDECCEFTVAMLDVDMFSRVNERLGYDEGDRVLIAVGEYIRACAVGGELYRYGGDEFGLVFPNMAKEEVFLLVEKLRAGFELTLSDGSKQTLSAGVADSDDAANTGELIRKAEGALFRAKTGGRDRVCLAREVKMVTKTAHYTVEQLQRLTRVSEREGIGEAILLREALDALLKKYDG